MFQHHCRQCGAVVCGPCSNKKLLLPGQGNGKAVRVCLQCYDAASKVKARPTTAVDSLNNKEQRNSADSSGGDSSGDDEEGNKEESHDEVIITSYKLVSIYIYVFFKTEIYIYSFVMQYLMLIIGIIKFYTFYSFLYCHLTCFELLNYVTL